MIVNILFLKMKAPEDVTKVQEALTGMKGRIAALVDISVCENIRDTGYDLVMTAKYDSLADMEEYLVDPVHVEVSGKIVPLIAAQASAGYED